MPAAEKTKREANPLDKYRSLQQRPCNGIEDCTLASTEAKQTPASRDFNRTARTSIAKAVMQLGETLGPDVPELGREDCGCGRSHPLLPDVPRSR